jgi:osmotically-inducible protein OsmY
MGANGVTALVAAVAMRRGQPLGPTNDQEIEEFISDALDLLPGAHDVEIRCDGGRVSFTGSVQQKRLKRDVGEIAWTIPGINDVQNNVSITPRRRSRSSTREPDSTTGSTAQARKQG